MLIKKKLIIMSWPCLISERKQLLSKKMNAFLNEIHKSLKKKLNPSNRKISL